MFISILDNDLYKFTMQQAAYLLYNEAEVEYTFINRGGTKFPEGFGNRLLEVVRFVMPRLQLTPQEQNFLKRQRFLTPGYIWYLSHYRYNPEQVDVRQDGGDLQIKIRGPWHSAILWETPLLAAISELYCTDQHPSTRIAHGAREKEIVLSERGILHADFGTRRRYSFENHKQVLANMLTVDNHTLVGTSNVYLAMRYGLKPIGTQAHEWYMFHGAQHYTANKDAMEDWIRMYGSDLGIALTDTYTTDYFLQDFGFYCANLFNGVRHDSGDPLVFTDKMIDHYGRLGINPKSKTIVFSDSLDVPKTISIHDYCQDRIHSSFGIGTNLTNDVGSRPLNIVIKMTRRKVNGHWRPTVKLSDDVGKHTGDTKEVEQWLEVVRR